MMVLLATQDRCEHGIYRTESGCETCAQIETVSKIAKWLERLADEEVDEDEDLYGDHDLLSDLANRVRDWEWG